jgi:uncharacterized protein YndB with AHSA1/START domain
MTVETAEPTTAPIRKSVRLACSPERAFELCTARTIEWWPVATHSIAGARVVDVTWEGRIGGRVSEVREDGTTHAWATVLVWDPPRSLVIAWHVNPACQAATEVEVRFVPDGDGTRVELEHRGWARLGGEAADARGDYDRGWDTVLAALADGAH